MSRQSASLIVASRGRPERLALCLSAIAQLVYEPFEVIVVADPSGLAVARTSKFADRLKIVPFDEPNLSKARNLGIEQSAGDIIAFLDDDAVPEPGWLLHLVAVFDDPRIMAATGFVRGRNGISYQVKGEAVDKCGLTSAVNVEGIEPLVIVGTPDRAISTIGTNCAFRREVFSKLGMFDPLFRYFLDESDMNMRLARAGAQTAIVPLAEVHHNTSASERRTADRIPKSLWDIGHSMAVYLRKYSDDGDLDACIAKAVSVQEKRLAARHARGEVTAAETERLLGTMGEGIEAGRAATLAPVPYLSAKYHDFRQFKKFEAMPEHVAVAGLSRRSKVLRGGARDLVESGKIVSLFLFSLTTRNHHVRYHPDGYWEHKGGLFGRANRDEPLFQPTTVAKRVAKELHRIAQSRYPWNSGV